jgi:hypothetical protein
MSRASVRSTSLTVLGGAFALASFLFAQNAHASAPAVASISPTAATNTTPVTITANGSDFFAGASMKLTKLNQTDIAATAVNVISPTQVSGTFDIVAAAPGTWSITITNPDLVTATCSCTFLVGANPPTVSALNPASRGQGATNQNVVITGTNFARGAIASFNGAGVTVNSTTWNSTTQVTANIDVGAGATTGARNVSVTNTDSVGATCSPVNCFTVTAAPTLTSTSPNSRGAGAQNEDIALIGSGFVGTPSVSFSAAGITVNSVTRNSATQVTANVSIAPGATPAGSTVTVTNPDAGSPATCGMLPLSPCFSINAAPSVTAAAPASRGAGAVNQDIIITGANFVATPTVAFSGTGINVNSVVHNSTLQITANITIAGSATPGARTITVTNPDRGPGVCACSFTVNTPPGLTSLSPASRGVGASNQNVTVTGSNFSGTPAVAFSGTGVTVNSVLMTDASHLTVNISVGGGAAATARNVTVTNTDGGQFTCAACFTVNALPVVSTASPDNLGQGASNRSVVLAGTGFVSGATVSFFPADITVNSSIYDSATQMTLSVSVNAAATTGAHDVRIQNADGSAQQTCTGCMTVNAAPTAISASPSARGQGATADVTITGSNFLNAPAVPVVTFAGGDIVTNSVSYTNATTLVANVTVASTASTGSLRNISIVNPDGGQATCTACFQVNAAPAPSSASPSSRGQGATAQTVSIFGTNFTASPQVAFSGAGVTVSGTPTLVNDGINPVHVDATVDVAVGAAPGARNVTVTNADGGVGLCPNCFTVNAAPSVSAPSTGSPVALGQGAASKTLHLVGTNFIATPTVAFSGTGVTKESTSFVSATQVDVVVSIGQSATTGARDVTVQNGDGSPAVVCTGCLSVTAAPNITTPSGGTPAALGQGAANRTLVLTGTGFENPAAVTFSGTGITVNTTTYDSATQITLNLSVDPSAAAGARNIGIANPDFGNSTCTGCFSVSASPVVTGVVPAALPNTGSQSPTINGTGFVSGATATLRKSGQADIVGTSTSVTGSTVIHTTIDLTAAAPGAWDVVVGNPDGGTFNCTACLTATASAPAVTNISPSSRGQGATNQNLVVTGTQFAHSAVLSLGGGVTVNSTTFDSVTQLTANVTIAGNATPGTRDASVANTDGQSGLCSACFTVNAGAVATSAAPSNLGQGATGRTVVVTGTGFAGTPVVTIGGADVTVNSTTLDSATQLTLSVDVGAAAAPGARDLSVANGDGSATDICGGCFTVRAAPTATSAAPNSRGQGASAQNVVVTGTGFVATPAAVVSGTGVTVNSVTHDSATQVTLNVDVSPAATAGARDLTITNPDLGTAAVCTGCFTVNAAAAATSATPSSRGQGATGQSVVLAGTGFIATPTVTFSGGGVTVNSVTRDSATQLTANIDVSPSATPGARSITVTNPDASTAAVCSGCFTVNAAPAATTATPNVRGQGATNQNLVVAGTGFLATPVVAFSGTGITVNSVTHDSATQLTVNVDVSPSAAAGARDFTVTNPDASTPAVCASCFNVETPAVATVAVPSTIKGDAIVLFSRAVSGVTASNFVLHQTGATAQLAGAPVCLDQAGAATSCAGGSVRIARATPVAALVPGQSYTVDVNPGTASTLVTGADGAVVAAATQAARVGLVQQEDTAAATYSWARTTIASAYGGSFVSERAAGARATYTFSGASVVWYTNTGPAQGRAHVSIDGVAKGGFNQFASGAHYKVPRTFSGLGSGTHTLVIAVDGVKGSTSGTDTFVGIDAFRSSSVTTNTPSLSAKWAPASHRSASAGKYAASDVARAAVNFTFRGTAVDWYAVKGPRSGIATVFVDGVNKGNFDNYSAAGSFSAQHITGLSDAVHTLRIVVASTRNPSSAGGMVGVDRFVVG